MVVDFSVSVSLCPENQFIGLISVVVCLLMFHVHSLCLTPILVLFGILTSYNCYDATHAASCLHGLLRYFFGFPYRRFGDGTRNCAKISQSTIYSLHHQNAVFAVCRFTCNITMKPIAFPPSKIHVYILFQGRFALLLSILMIASAICRSDQSCSASIAINA